MDDLASARPYYERALAIRENTLGPNHPDTARSLNNLGFLLQGMGDLAGAQPYYERSLAINEQALGPEHPDTATSLNSLGGLLYEMGDLAGAQRYYERTLTIREKALGPEHPDTATSLNDLGLLLKDVGDIATAQMYLERALKIFETTLGTNHPNTQTIRNNYMVISGSGAIAQGTGAIAVGERGVNVGGNVSGSILTGDSNIVIQTSRNTPPHFQDSFSLYEDGLERLFNSLDNTEPRYGETLVYQQRLIENIGRTRRFGDTALRQAERAEIIEHLNELALSRLGSSFNELCQETKR